MKLDTNTCYQALLAHDARFDGVFFVGVGTTGIYCRTVCTAKTPRRENCTFYPSAGAAERAGYRPCLRCRPELAPGSASVDSVSRLAAAAAGRIEDGALNEGSTTQLAAELGVTDRHLRRAVEQEFGVSPVELAQTWRLLLAKRLLTDTVLPVTEIAFASGFSSVSRFNALFKTRYRLNPTQLRKERKSQTAQEALTCDVAYRPPYDWDSLRLFLEGHITPGMEAMDGETYLRTAAYGKHEGWIAVSPIRGKNALRVRLSMSLAPVLLPVLARVKRLFDLSAHPQLISAHLGPLSASRPGLRVPGAYDGFETAVRTILGQQVSIRSANTLAGRLLRAFGTPIETPFPALTHRSPTAERFAGAEIGDLAQHGVIAARANSIILLAREIAEGRLRLEPDVDREKTLDQLRALPGVGEWTAQVIAMRALAWPDAFPHSDLGIRKALNENSLKRILEMAEGWRPWRAYAVMHLWKSLEATT